MKNAILNSIYEESIGLTIYSLPTGYGKSYCSFESIYDYIKNGGNKKIFFVTPQKKNRDISGIKEFYVQNHDDNFTNEIFELKSYIDFIIENFDKILDEIPEEIKQTKEYINLHHKMKVRDSSLYKNDIDNEISEIYEPEFRYLIHRIINKEFKNTSERKKAILYDKKYNWIRILYPQVEIDKYQAIFLTSRKLIMKLDVIYKDSFDLLSSYLLNNAIIYLDEFDSIKIDITGVLIDQSIKYKESLISMFEQLYSTCHNHQLCDKYNNLMSKELLDDYLSIKEETEKIYSNFYIGYDFKSVEENTDGKNFIFNSKAYISILNGNKTHIVIENNSNDKINHIHFVSKEVYDSKEHNKELNVYSLLRVVDNLINRTSLLFYSLAENLYKENKNKDNGLSLESALSSVYNEFRISREMKDFMINLRKPGYKYGSKSFFYDNSFYSKGFQYYEFIDSTDHESFTKFNYYDYRLTAEKILIYMCNRNKVIGLSATANVDSVISNFDLEYIKKILGDYFHYPSPNFIAQVKRELDETYKKYNHEIEIHTEIISVTNPSIFEELNMLFDDYEFTINFYRENIEQLDEYYKKRYVKIFKVIKLFIDNLNIQSFLCVNSWLLNDKKNSNESLVEVVFNKLKRNEEIELWVLNGNEFKENKKRILEKLENGKKIFVMTSYQTIGKGQNLNYSIANLDEDLVILSDENSSRTKTKDFDAIYLGDITNIIPNIADKITIEQLYEYIIIVWAMYERREIDYVTAKKETRKAFNAYLRADRSNNSNIRKGNSYQNYRSHLIIQTIGRLNRTFVKRKNIYIYLDDNLLKNIGLDAYDETLSTPEVRATFDCIKMYMNKPMENKKMQLILENEKISFDAKILINSYLNKTWDAESVNSWRNLRKNVLINPNINDDHLIASINNQNINYYITSNQPFNKYFYYQRNDFSEVYIAYDNQDEITCRLERNELSIIVEVSEKNCGLDILMKNQQIKNMFEERGYATSFKKMNYMICPIIYNNIYKGALGEVVGKYILEKFMTFKLEDLDANEFYEYFDYKINNIYFDFKHWRKTMKLSDKEYCQNVRNKLREINGSKAIIINLINQGDEYTFIDHDDVIEIPCLINLDGNFHEGNIKKVMEVIADASSNK